MNIKPIAYFHSPFSSKFGIPKQSGLVVELRGTIVFAPEYRDPDFIRGIEGFDYLWLIWEFSANKHASTSSVVRPPVLGGNTKMGVFATRSPFRPNNLGLSSVRLERVEYDTPNGPTLYVLGADLMDGTPIYDIKPYLEYADAHSNIRSGFTDANKVQYLDVVIPETIEKSLPSNELLALRKVLSLDPRPHYHASGDRVYGMPFNGNDVHFRVEDSVCYVIDIVTL